MNDKNLKKGKATQFKSGENAASNGRKGGLANGQHHREKRTIQQIIGIGQYSGYCCYGKSNVFIGRNAGYKTSSATQNIFIGNSAGEQNTTGCGNVYIGGQAGKSYRCMIYRPTNSGYNYLSCRFYNS